MLARVKRGQVGIWVMLGVILVASLALLFFIQRKPRVDVQQPQLPSADVESFVKGCVESALSDALKVILPQGGFFNPQPFVTFNGYKVQYLCKNRNYFSIRELNYACQQQVPPFVPAIEAQLSTFLQPRMLDCYNEMKSEFRSLGSEVEFDQSTAPEVSVDLRHGKIVTKVKKQVKVTKQGETRTFEEVSVETPSPVFDMAFVAESVLQRQFALYAGATDLGYDLINYRRTNKLLVTPYRISDGTVVYKIEDVPSKQFMYVAFRGAVLPHGMAVP
ncbi:hypothetical protein D6817_02865 [Candidatus Pacearchaeota archaeon]|nr:MAG: hypothetical protein D6817_02865 [Candidatus Pacearchaeota archaeon]